MKPKQLDFFSTMNTPGTRRVNVEIFKEGDRYIATIAGGWWMAYGTSGDNAKKNVIERYKSELMLR